MRTPRLLCTVLAVLTLAACGSGDLLPAPEVRGRTEGPEFRVLVGIWEAREGAAEGATRLTQISFNPDGSYRWLRGTIPAGETGPRSYSIETGHFRTRGAWLDLLPVFRTEHEPGRGDQHVQVDAVWTTVNWLRATVSGDQLELRYTPQAAGQPETVQRLKRFTYDH